MRQLAVVSCAVLLIACGDDDEPAPLSREFSSADNVIDFDGTVSLLHRHGLTMDFEGPTDAVELLR